jgi:hypothetical protein
LVKTNMRSIVGNYVCVSVAVSELHYVLLFGLLGLSKCVFIVAGVRIVLCEF